MFLKGLGESRRVGSSLLAKGQTSKASHVT